VGNPGEIGLGFDYCSGGLQLAVGKGSGEVMTHFGPDHRSREKSEKRVEAGQEADHLWQPLKDDSSKL
jgi:hypothetical protein